MGRYKQDAVLRQEHTAGREAVRRLGRTTIPIHDPRGGPVQQAHLFVAVPGSQFLHIGGDGAGRAIVEACGPSSSKRRAKAGGAGYTTAFLSAPVRREFPLH